MAIQNDQNNQQSKNSANPAAATSSATDWKRQPAQPDESMMPKGKKPKIGVAVTILILLTIIGGIIIYNQKASKKAEEAGVSPSPIPLSSVNPEISPPVPPPVVDTKKETLRTYFKSASPKNFREDFLNNLPDRAADDYIKYSSAAEDSEKIKYARSFYMFLNNPAVNRNDPEFLNFVADIRADLESKLGGPLF